LPMVVMVSGAMSLTGSAATRPRLKMIGNP
jgi:hypothetical protein